ncbi:MAG TPA: cyclopropane-fatty-acyl-phospholipid synthase family protein [Allosphingosinicella sp.]|jgi:cyclopropane-fatty-acyl-phospholipid synthase|nr:cyclopropane-fatty-acyl-phospholipid synthase family protein [Allosphingosinicella sp.]
MIWRLLEKILGRLVRRGELVVTDAKGEIHRFGAPDPVLGRIGLRFNDGKVLRDILRDPTLGFAEAYMAGRIDFEEGDVLALSRLIKVNGRFEDGNPRGKRFRDNFSGFAAWRQARNREARSKQNVAHHYDIGNALYRLFLDEDLQYSCAYFTDSSNSLEQAQADKKAHIAAKLYLKPGQKVLDIGCGWGGMALYLHRHFDVDVLGVTLSEEQLKLARERAAAEGVSHRVKFELLDYRRVEGVFDRIVSVGMFEHVGHAHYDEFFGVCRKLLARDGVMLLHTIGRFDEPRAGEPFADKYIFPGYHLPNLSQIIEASQRWRLIHSDVETLRLHYAYTLQHWIERCEAHRDEIVAMYDERFYRMWEIYLAGALAMFEDGGGCNYQIQYVRDRHAVPITRDYMIETEQRLRAAEAALTASAPQRRTA